MKQVMKHAIIAEDLKAYIKAGHRAGSKKAKGLILDKLELATGMSRKSLIRHLRRQDAKLRFNPSPGRDPKTSALSLHGGMQSGRGRPRVYGNECAAALAYLWGIYNHPDAERLHPVIPEAVRIMRRDNLWSYSSAATRQLLAMSLATVKRRTVAMGKQAGLMRGLSTTRPSSIKEAVPVYLGDWSNRGLGYGQIDTVVHSGPKLMGTMAYTVDYVDSLTYWQEPIAQLDKSEKATLTAIRELERRLPFQLRGLHPDTGSEFINWRLKDWCDDKTLGREGERGYAIELTRSRPNKHNDNCYIEQRNNVVVRRYIGYARYDCLKAVEIINEIYLALRLYINFFQPSYKLQAKVSYESLGIHRKGCRRVYDQPMTPYARLMALPDTEAPDETKCRLTKQYESLNPLLLKRKIDALTIKLERVQKELGYHY